MYFTCGSSTATHSSQGPSLQQLPCWPSISCHTGNFRDCSQDQHHLVTPTLTGASGTQIFAVGNSEVRGDLNSAKHVTGPLKWTNLSSFFQFAVQKVFYISKHAKAFLLVGRPARTMVKVAFLTTLSTNTSTLLLKRALPHSQLTEQRKLKKAKQQQQKKTRTQPKLKKTC